MSAFICSEKHIATVATEWAKRHPEADTQALADELMAENVASVNARYGDVYVAEPVRLAKAVIVTPVQLTGLVRCLRYQSCEHPEWKGSASAILLDRFLEELPEQISDGTWSI